MTVLSIRGIRASRREKAESATRYVLQPMSPAAQRRGARRASVEASPTAPSSALAAPAGGKRRGAGDRCGPADAVQPAAQPGPPAARRKPAPSGRQPARV